jgi:hypothetical protein
MIETGKMPQSRHGSFTHHRSVLSHHKVFIPRRVSEFVRALRKFNLAARQVAALRRADGTPS